MATRDCLGKIRWVRRLPVHTLLSLETVKDYQLLTFSKSGPPRSQPTLSFFNSLQAHTGLALPWFLCKNWFPAHLLLQRLSNWLPDKRHAVFFFFFFPFYWDNSQAPDWLQGNDSYQRIAGWAAALAYEPTQVGLAFVRRNFLLHSSPSLQGRPLASVKMLKVNSSTQKKPETWPFLLGLC